MRHVFFALLIVCGTASFAQAELFPDSGPPGATVTIGGAAFGEFVSTAENRVDFNGVPALIQLWEPDLVMVKVPLGAKSGDVTVAGPQGTTVAGRFAIQRVKIAKLVPPEAEPGSVLTIEGEHFGNTAGSPVTWSCNSPPPTRCRMGPAVRRSHISRVIPCPFPLFPVFRSLRIRDPSGPRSC